MIQGLNEWVFFFSWNNFYTESNWRILSAVDVDVDMGVMTSG